MVTHERPPDMPDLRVVPVAELLLHEQHDAQRTGPLLHRLQGDGVLRNPPVVAAIRGEPRYVVLDGANRVTAMQALGVAHVVVQVVDYEDADLALHTWHHLIKGIAAERVPRMLRALRGVAIDLANATRARAQLARREILAFVETRNGETWALRASGDLHQRSRRLNEIVDLYKGQAQVFRASADHLPSLLPLHADAAALVVFPRFAPAEIVDLARVGARLPAGITRHVIPRRALRLNVPLAVLNGGSSLSEKNSWLADWLAQRQASKTVRYYQESTFLFDE
jgi:hypothetical protein